MPPAGWLLLAAIVLIFVAGWCAVAQAAMERADGDGLDQYGSLLTLLRVCAEASAAALVTLAFAHWLGGGWQVFLPAAGLLVLARYVLTGAGPRAMGKQRAERVAATARRLLRPLRAVLGPLLTPLAKVTGVLPFGGSGADPELNGRSGVNDLVDYIESQDEIEPGEREMVRSVFELGDTIVREVMVPRTDMVFLEREKTLSQALSLALRSGFSRIPVTGESTDDVVGIAYLKDIVSWLQEHPDAGEPARGEPGAGEPGRGAPERGELAPAEPERVEKVMRPATYVPDSKPVDELLRQMQAMRIHVAIVIDEYGGTAGLVTIEDILEEIVGESTDDVVGIAYLKDIVAWDHEHPGTAETERVEKVMRPASYVPESKPVNELLRQMQVQRSHVAVVIDEYGGTAGLVTIEDILEEIVGEIADEYDDELAPVEWLEAPDRARVTARLPVTELEELFGVRVDAEDVETVGGLLAHLLGRVPIAGSEANVAGLHLTAENLAGRRNKLGTVLVERIPARSPGKD